MSDIAAGRGKIRGGGSFLRSFAVHMRVIGALVLRELHVRYGRENIGYLWMIGEPMLLASVIGSIHAANGHGGHTAYGPDVQPVPFVPRLREQIGRHSRYERTAALPSSSYPV